jgi:hypothetical protein
MIYLVLKNKFRDAHPGSGIWIFFHPGVKKAPDPGSWSATLHYVDRRELILSVVQVGDDDESTERPERRRGAGGTEGQEKWRQLQIQLRFGILLISHHSVPRILSHSYSVDSGLVTAVNIMYLFSLLLLRIK